MDGFGSAYRGSCGDRRVEIVSGKGGQIYMGGARSPDQGGNPARGSRGGQTSSVDSKPWSFNDPEMKRRKRIAKYKVYTVEGKAKASLRKGFRWIKNKCLEFVHGF